MKTSIQRVWPFLLGRIPLCRFSFVLQTIQQLQPMDPTLPKTFKLNICLKTSNFWLLQMAAELLAIFRWPSVTLEPYMVTKGVYNLWYHDEVENVSILLPDVPSKSNIQ